MSYFDFTGEAKDNLTDNALVVDDAVIRGTAHIADARIADGGGVISGSAVIKGYAYIPDSELDWVAEQFGYDFDEE